MTELVAAGALVLLAGVVFSPAMRNARSRAREASCVTHLASFGQGMLMYANDNFDYFPGLNTTGVPLRVKQITMLTDPNVLHSPTMPVQSTDWLTPLAQNLSSTPLPANRAARWHHLWTTYRCPQSTLSAVPYAAAGGSTPDAADFELYEWPAPSYLMPMWFQYWGQSDQVFLAYREHPNPAIQLPLYASAAPTSWEVRVQSYRARLDLMTSPQTKVFVSDGTRFVTSASAPLDFEINPLTALFGAFAAGGGWFGGDNSFGVRAGTLNWSLDPVGSGSISEGYNLGLSYRHEPEVPSADFISNDPGSAAENLGAINAVFFDGHVENQGDRRSRSIAQWYPSGGVVQESVNMTTEPVGSVIP